VERLSANWKWILMTALPIVFAIFVFLPGHPRVRAASDTSVDNSLDDDIVLIPYALPDPSKPSPFPIIKVKHYRPAPVATPPDSEQ
jgi:hypothetical protein